jgi:hypothetical protein
MMLHDPTSDCQEATHDMSEVRRTGDGHELTGQGAAESRPVSPMSGARKGATAKLRQLARPEVGRDDAPMSSTSESNSRACVQNQGAQGGHPCVPERVSRILGNEEAEGCRPSGRQVPQCCQGSMIKHQMHENMSLPGFPSRLAVLRVSWAPFAFCLDPKGVTHGATAAQPLGERHPSTLALTG